MPLKVEENGTQREVVFVDPAPPIEMQVPSRQEAFEALDMLQALTISHHPNVFVSGKLYTWHDATDILRRYILTR